MVIIKVFSYNMTTERVEWQLTIWQVTIHSTSLPSWRTVTLLGLLGGKRGNSAVSISSLASVLPLLSSSTTEMRSCPLLPTVSGGSYSSSDTGGLLSHNVWVAPDGDSIVIWVIWTRWGCTISSRKKPSSSCLYLQQVNWVPICKHTIFNWKQLLLLIIERVWFLLSCSK
jgi:hypothetical protein